MSFEDDFFDFVVGMVKFQIVFCGPLLYMRDFVESRCRVGGRDKEIGLCIICVFEDTVSCCHRMQIGSRDQIRHWSQARSLDDTCLSCFHLCDSRTLASNIL